MTEDGGGLYLAPMLYDVVNAPGTAPEVTALERAARRFGALRADATVRSGKSHQQSGVWIEPACGTGRYLRELLRRGYTVRGYDAQPQMVAYAAGRLVRTATGGAGNRQPCQARFDLAVADFTSPAESLCRLGPADVAFCPVNSLRHMQSDRDVLAHMEQIATLLSPTGVYLVGLDMHDPDRGIEEDVWKGRRGRLEVTKVVQYLPPEPGSRSERVIVEVVAVRPRGREHHSFAYDLRTYTELQWEDLVERSPLRRRAVCDAVGWPAGLRGRDDRAMRLPYQIEVLTLRYSTKNVVAPLER